MTDQVELLVAYLVLDLVCDFVDTDVKASVAVVVDQHWVVKNFDRYFNELLVLPSPCRNTVFIFAPCVSVHGV